MTLSSESRVLEAVLVAAALLSVTPNGSAQAQPSVDGEVFIILASEIPGVIDPRISNIEALRMAPFDRYQTMTLLGSPRVQLAVGQPEIVDLPNGRRVRLVLVETTSSGRYRLQVSINRPGEQDYLPAMRVVASPGSPVLIAGQSFRAGTLVVGIQLSRQQGARP